MYTVATLQGCADVCCVLCAVCCVLCTEHYVLCTVYLLCLWRPCTGRVCGDRVLVVFVAAVYRALVVFVAAVYRVLVELICMITIITA